MEENQAQQPLQPTASAPTPDSAAPASPSMPASNPASAGTPAVPGSSSMPGHADPMKEQSSGAVVWVLVAIIVLVILGVGGYYVWSSNQPSEMAAAPTAAPTVEVTATPTPEVTPEASDEATMELNKVSTSDSTQAIKTDLDKTNLDDVAKEATDLGASQ